MQRDYDPAFHLAVGQAIAPLRQQGVLMIGSGLSYHNLRQLSPQAKQPSHQFDQWLTETLCTLRGKERQQQLTHWSQAPAARIAHPREDHLVPLFVAVGAAINELGDQVYHEDAWLGGIAVSNLGNSNSDAIGEIQSNNPLARRLDRGDQLIPNS
jgi:aromatic ring-opening dioxygenase catalytic subunit (LigB family)